MFYSCDICTLTYALRQDHAASRQMWTSALQVLVSRLSPLSGMQGECCSFHVLRPLARRKLLVSPLPLFSPQRNSDAIAGGRPVGIGDRLAEEQRPVAEGHRPLAPLNIPGTRSGTSSRGGKRLAAKVLRPGRARHSPCRRWSWRLFKRRDLVAPSRRTTGRRRRRSELR